MAQDTEPARPAAAATGTEPEESEAEESGTDGFARLRRGHKALRALLGECEKVNEDGAEDLLARLTVAWAGHAAAHAALFDCATESGLDEFAPLDEAGIEGDLVSFLLRRAGRDLEGAMQRVGLRVTARLIGTLIEQEEKPRNGLLAKVEGAGVDPDDLGRRIDACKRAQPSRDGAHRPRLRHLVVNQEDTMPRNMPERDEEGRFISDHDHRGRPGGVSRGGSRYDDDDRRYSRGSCHDDDDRRYSCSRYDDDDRDYVRDRGQGDWFGDAEGHSEAVELGWERRRREDDDRSPSRRSRY